LWRARKIRDGVLCEVSPHQKAAVTNAPALTTVADLNWNIAGAGDFDGKAGGTVRSASYSPPTVPNDTGGI
jgi:hypothetical protein